MEKYAIFLDIDGTLTADGEIPVENIKAINKAREKGNFVFINTGRSFGFIPQCVKQQLNLDGFVAGIGSHVVCGEKTLKRERLSLEETLPVVEYYLPTGRFVIFEGENKSVAFGPERNDIDTIMIHSVDEFIACSDIKLTKGFLSGVLEPNEQDYFKQRYNFFQHSNYSEYSHKGCTKSAGMKLILDYLGIPVEGCVAMGDSINDVDMLEFAGISVAMGNAADYIKEKCTIVTEDNRAAGVAKAIYKILGI